MRIQEAQKHTDPVADPGSKYWLVSFYDFNFAGVVSGGDVRPADRPVPGAVVPGPKLPHPARHPRALPHRP